MHVREHLIFGAKQLPRFIMVHCLITLTAPEKGVGICKGVPIGHPEVIWGLYGDHATMCMPCSCYMGILGK